MAKSRSQSDWWRTGKLWRRLLSLGAILGAAGALVFHVSYTMVDFNPAGIGFSLFFLIVEVIVMAILGWTAAWAVVIGRLAVPNTAPRIVRAGASGVIALVSSTALTYGLFTLVPLTLSADRWATAVVTGALAGGAFALVSYRHESET